MNNNSPLGIIMATRIEADPFIRGLRLSAIEKKPFAVLGNEEVILAISGIGKSNAAIAAAHLISRYHPERIFNLGAAGSASGKQDIGTIMHINKIVELDRVRPFSVKPVIHKPDVLDGFSQAALATQDRPVLAPEDRAAADQYADCIDMEWAAIVQACRAYGIKVYLFKIITDTAESGESDIIRNILNTRIRLFEF